MWIFFVLKNSIESLESEGFPVAGIAKKSTQEQEAENEKKAKTAASAETIDDGSDTGSVTGTTKEKEGGKKSKAYPS